MSMRYGAAVAALVGGLLPQAALAHTGGHAFGFAAGLGHPAGGLDHLLAMVMVGMLAAQLGGRALLALPAAFVALMAVGGAAGMAGFGLPFVETGIALSVVALGAALAFALRAPLVAVALAVGGFALFHGQAHGAELPPGAAGLAYAAGFLTATALLHGAGLAFGWMLISWSTGAGGLVLRSGGAAAAAVGVGIMLGFV